MVGQAGCCTGRTGMTDTWCCNENEKEKVKKCTDHRLRYSLLNWVANVHFPLLKFWRIFLLLVFLFSTVLFFSIKQWRSSNELVFLMLNPVVKELKQEIYQEDMQPNWTADFRTYILWSLRLIILFIAANFFVFCFPWKKHI